MSSSSSFWSGLVLALVLVLVLVLIVLTCLLQGRAKHDEMWNCMKGAMVVDSTGDEEHCIYAVKLFRDEGGVQTRIRT